MSDELVDQLKAHAAEHQRRMLVETAQRNFQKSRDEFVCKHARNAYEELVRLMKEKVEEVKAKPGNSHEFVVAGHYIQLEHVALYYSFDQPIVDHPDNELVLSLGVAPFKDVFGFSPKPERHKLEAISEGDNREIVWVGKLGRFNSAELAELALKMLVDYYYAKKPR